MASESFTWRECRGVKRGRKCGSRGRRRGGVTSGRWSGIISARRGGGSGRSVSGRGRDRVAPVRSARRGRRIHAKRRSRRATCRIFGRLRRVGGRRRRVVRVPVGRRPRRSRIVKLAKVVARSIRHFRIPRIFLAVRRSAAVVLRGSPSIRTVRRSSRTVRTRRRTK